MEIIIIIIDIDISINYCSPQLLSPEVIADWFPLATRPPPLPPPTALLLLVCCRDDGGTFEQLPAALLSDWPVTAISCCRLSGGTPVVGGS